MMKAPTKTNRSGKYRLKVGQKYYAVFQMIPASRYDGDTTASLYWKFITEISKEKWENDDEDRQLVPDFIAIVRSLAEVAELVRQDTSEKYAIVAGSFSMIEPHVQVFMGGVNINTLQAEGWDGE